VDAQTRWKDTAVGLARWDRDESETVADAAQMSSP
jgi:hypothetical protein